MMPTAFGHALTCSDGPQSRRKEELCAMKRALYGDVQVDGQKSLQTSLIDDNPAWTRLDEHAFACACLS